MQINLKNQSCSSILCVHSDDIFFFFFFYTFRKPAFRLAFETQATCSLPLRTKIALHHAAYIFFRNDRKRPDDRCPGKSNIVDIAAIATINVERSKRLKFNANREKSRDFLKCENRFIRN